MKITKTKKGMYRARVYIGRNEKGQPIQKVFSDTDKSRLRLQISEYLQEHRDGADLRSFSVAMKVCIKLKSPTLSPSTVREYTDTSKMFEERYPVFCRLALSEIRKVHIQELVNSMVDKGLSPKTIRNYIGFVSTVMTCADYRIPKVTLPQKIRPECYVPSEETMKKTLQAAAGTELEVPLALAVFGLRRGEICGLHVDDLEGNVLHIHRAVVRDKNGDHVEKTTKTYASDRYVQIPPALAARIRERGYVTHLTPAAFSCRFARLLKREGIEHFRLHDMRHFFVSYCHNVLRLSDAQIQKLGGWKTDYVMKSHYLQAMNEKQAAMLVANKMQKIIG